MSGMIRGGYVQHEVGLATDLLILGITALEPKDESHQERVIIRSTLTLLEMLQRNIKGQMEAERTAE